MRIVSYVNRLVDQLWAPKPNISVRFPGLTGRVLQEVVFNAYVVAKDAPLLHLDVFWPSLCIRMTISILRMLLVSRRECYILFGGVCVMYSHTVH